ncbi:hypothetical protein ACFLZ5_03205 [Thermodesulfobacteriota bacterium]
MKTLTLRFTFLFLVAVMLLACPLVMAGQGSVLERIHAADQPFDNMQIESAHQLSVKTVVAKESYQGGAFRVLARKDAISRYRCSVCHTKKIPQVRDGALITHGDIRINHGEGENELACIECHDRQDRDFLVDMEGKKIDFDHSYKLCGQCHFRPKRDWLGGAHGKRVTYWAGERVVMNCTSCHDPHSPAFKTKMPETFSLPLEE